MKNKKIIVTGGAGFIGTHIVRVLQKKNEVSIIDTKFGSDVTKKDWFAGFKEVDYIFHFAAVVGVDYVSEHPQETEHTIIEGMKNIIELARENNAKVVYSSTSSIHEAAVRPTPYNTAKLKAENMLAESGVSYSIIRYFNVYGPGQQRKMVVSRFIQKGLRDEPIEVYSPGTQTRDFTYITDAVSATLRVAEESTNMKLDIGAGKETRIIDLAKMIIKMTGSKSEIRIVRAPESRKEYEIKNRVCKPTEINSRGIFCNTSLADGLAKTIEYEKFKRSISVRKAETTDIKDMMDLYRKNYDKLPLEAQLRFQTSDLSDCQDVVTKGAAYLIIVENCLAGIYFFDSFKKESAEIHVLTDSLFYGKGLAELSWPQVIAMGCADWSLKKIYAVIPVQSIFCVNLVKRNNFVEIDQGGLCCKKDKKFVRYI
jgi:nucleoside-diphosphate-sugar epimerase